MNKLILKITDDKIYLNNLNNNKLIVATLPKNIVKEQKIIDIENFIQKLNKIIKDNKLTTLLIKSKIYIIIPSYYNKTDIFLLDYTFKILNYYNYEFVKENTLYEHLLKSNTLVISLWDSIGEISYKENNKIISKNINTLKELIDKKEDVIVINNINFNKFKIFNKNIIYLEPNQHFIINKLKEKISNQELITK